MVITVKHDGGILLYQGVGYGIYFRVWAMVIVSGCGLW